MAHVTPTFIKENFEYKDGELFRNNKRVGYYDKSCKYLRTKVKNKTYLVHRLIFAYHHGYFPKFIDHIDRDKLNNKIENLREVKQQCLNTVNSEKREDNTSGFKGVTWHKSSKKWHSSIFKDKKRYYLGVFSDKIEAAKVYNQAAIEMFGEFAYLNKI